MHGHFTEGRTWLERILATGGGATINRAKVFSTAGTLAWLQRDFRQATHFHEQALAHYREADDREGVAFSINNLGVQAVDQAEYARAAPLFEESLARFRELGDQYGVIYALNNLGETKWRLGEYECAITLFTESAATSRQHGDQWCTAVILVSLGRSLTTQGALARATASFHDSLHLSLELGDKVVTAMCLEGLAGVAARNGQDRDGARRAARLFGTSAALRESVGAPLSPIEREDVDQDMAIVRGRLDEADFAAAFGEGQTMSTDDAVAYALKSVHESDF